MNKKIANVVFYKFWDPTREDAMQQACIFYEDGTILNTTHEEGLEAAYELANAEKLTGKQFRAALNRDKIYTMSGADFERRYQEFVKLSREEVAAAVNAEMVNIEATRRPVEQKTQVVNDQPSVTAQVQNDVPNYDISRGQASRPTSDDNQRLTEFQRNMDQIIAYGEERLRRLREEANRQYQTDPQVNQQINQEIDELEAEMKAQQQRTAAEVQRILNERQTNYAYQGQTPVQPTRTSAQQGTQAQQTTNGGPAIPVVPIFVPTGETQNTATAGQATPSQGQAATTTEQTTAEKKAAQSTNGAKKSAKKPSLWQRIKKSKAGRRVTALLVAASLLLGGVGGYHLGKNSKAGLMTTNNISLMQMDDDANQAQDAAYKKLLKETKNEDLRAIMTKQSQNLDMYNRDFAAEYLEAGKDVKAALSWDEVIATNLAYNDYTPEQIRLMFNGSTVNALGLSHAFKNGQLQLMGAYVISNRENPVNSAGFINDEEGKKFVEKYEDLFYDCKEATGDARVAAVNKFYKELHKDFPISDDVREIGLSHADGRKQVKKYMTAVAPIVAASEIMWQNLEIDHTLSDKATAYFNDIGLCNIAEDAFERAERITEDAEINEDVPTYEEFMNAKITELMIEGNYVIDDAHRDLSQLDEFQKWVNGHFVFDEDGYNTGVITRTIVTTHTKTTYRTETTTHKTSDRNEAVNAVGEDAVKRAEDAVNEQIDRENAAAKAEGEKKAEEKREELQEEADRESERLEEEVKKDEEDLQDKIEDANDKIENNEPVNEDDLGHGADFDNDHSDSNGNLNDNVGDITTDGDGAYDHDDPLPDPDEMGEMFDQGVQSQSYRQSEVQSNSDIVDQMIRDMESQGQQSEADYLAPGLDSYEEPYEPGKVLTK